MQCSGLPNNLFWTYYCLQTLNHCLCLFCLILMCYSPSLILNAILSPSLEPVLELSISCVVRVVPFCHVLCMVFLYGILIYMVLYPARIAQLAEQQTIMSQVLVSIPTPDSTWLGVYSALHPTVGR